jgi:hypothetical protein
LRGGSIANAAYDEVVVALEVGLEEAIADSYKGKSKGSVLSFGERSGRGAFD